MLPGRTQGTDSSRDSRKVLSTFVVEDILIFQTQRPYTISGHAGTPRFCGPSERSRNSTDICNSLDPRVNTFGVGFYAQTRQISVTIKPPGDRSGIVVVRFRNARYQGGLVITLLPKLP